MRGRSQADQRAATAVMPEALGPSPRLALSMTSGGSEARTCGDRAIWFGLKTQYNSDWVGRYQVIMSDIETININPNVAYRVFDWLAVPGRRFSMNIRGSPTLSIPRP
jgi:long-subunit fatty acid transport protein